MKLFVENDLFWQRIVYKSLKVIIARNIEILILNLSLSKKQADSLLTGRVKYNF